MSTLEERFWEKVNKTLGHGPKGECWVWTASKNGDGYGQFRIGARNHGAHRVAYSLEFSWDLFSKIQVLHQCDNPGCVNHSHLFLGTQQDNVNDCVQKGRLNWQINPELRPRGNKHWARRNPEKVSRGDEHYSRRNPELVARGDRHWSHLYPEKIKRGSSHTNSKLTEELVRGILKDPRSQRAIAKDLGVSFQLISQIKKRQTWAHVT